MTEPFTTNVARTHTKANGNGKSKGKDLKGKGKTKATGYSRQPRMGNSHWRLPLSIV